MPTSSPSSESEVVFDKRRLQAMGVLLPITLQPLSFLPGRHPLGRAGEGMRFLRVRRYQPGEDNPRDIDKFSPPGEPLLNEWESEAQANVLLLADISGSMAFGPKASLRNLALVQITYSLWRASDRVRTLLYGEMGSEEIRERNLRSQLEQLIGRLGQQPVAGGMEAFDALPLPTAGQREDIIFLVSDFIPASASEEERILEPWRSALRRQSASVIPVVITFQLPLDLRGSIKLWDPERRSQRLTLLSGARIDRINQLERRRVKAVEALFRALGLDYLILREQREVYSKLSQLARARRGRRA